MQHHTAYPTSPTAVSTFSLAMSFDGNLTTLKQMSPPQEMKETCVSVIAQIFSNLPEQSNHTVRLTSRDKAVQYLQRIKTQRSDFFSELECCATHLHNLYETLSLDPVPIESMPSLASFQANSTISSLSSEFEQFRSSFEHLACNQEPSSAVDRYFSQVSFFSYLDSEIGKAIIERLSEKMNAKERVVFNRAIPLLKSLSQNYLKILSYLEAARMLLKNDSKRPLEDLWETLEFVLCELLIDISNENSDFIIPLGWSLNASETEGKLGHQLICFIEDLGESDEKITRIFDTALRMPDEQIKSAVGLRINNPEPLCQKRCCYGFATKKFTSNIHKLAKALMLQIPIYTSEFIKKVESTIHSSLSQDRIEKELNSIIYSILKGEPLVDGDSPSPLESWTFFPFNACTSLQPFLQFLVLKAAKSHHIDLSNNEEINLRGYCELLQQSYKLFLLENFKIHVANSTITDLFRDILYQKMHESECKITSDHRF